MENEKNQTAPLSREAQDLEYENFAAEDRRRKVWLLTAGLVLAVACAAAFIGTITSIGSMSAHVPALFDTEESETTPVGDEGAGEAP